MPAMQVRSPERSSSFPLSVSHWNVHAARLALLGSVYLLDVMLFGADIFKLVMCGTPRRLRMAWFGRVDRRVRCCWAAADIRWTGNCG